MDSAEREEQFRTGEVVTLAGAHFVHDIFTAFLPSLLPLLIVKHGISFFRAGLLDFSLRIPSVFNPLVGLVLDRRGYARALVIASPTVTAVAMGLIGLTPNFGVLVVLLLACGLSVAALHVSIPVVTAEVAGKRIGRGMSFFMLGGELGRVAGPVLAVQAVALFGLEGIWRVSAAGVAASVVLWWRFRAHRARGKRSSPLGLIALWKTIRRTILAVAGIIVARSLMAVALTTFLPTFLYQQGQSLLYGGVALATYELAGALGALTSGTVSDRLGRRRVLLGAVVLSPLLMFVFLAVPPALVLPVLALLGFSSLAIPPVLMAVMIESLPRNRAAANGTYMMLAFAVRSLIALAVGGLSDVLGMKGAYLCCAGLALLGVGFVLLLPVMGNTYRATSGKES